MAIFKFEMVKLSSHFFGDSFSSSCFLRFVKHFSIFIIDSHHQYSIPSKGKFAYFTIVCTLKPRYNEPRYSEFRDMVNKTQLPFLGCTKYSEQKGSEELVRYIEV